MEMTNQVFAVFLSSTARDLGSHRTKVHGELSDTPFFKCVHQGGLGAEDASAIEFCRSSIKKSDIFIGLIGQRRGWEPKGDKRKRSITEMEHDWARQARRRRFVYVAPDDFPVPGDVRE